MFEHETPYNIRSKCGNYSVARYATAAGFLFEAWYRPNPVQLAANLQTADEAKEICEKHDAGRGL